MNFTIYNFFFAYDERKNYTRNRVLNLISSKYKKKLIYKNFYTLVKALDSHTIHYQAYLCIVI